MNWHSGHLLTHTQVRFIGIFGKFQPMRCFTGRSIKVTDGNVAEAYKKLETILGRNKVRAQLRLAERHEKKGAKRRRLSSERWRKQFSHEASFTTVPNFNAFTMLDITGAEKGATRHQNSQPRSLKGVRSYLMLQCLRMQVANLLLLVHVRISLRLILIL